jgi:hypothetical protein
MRVKCNENRFAAGCSRLFPERINDLAVAQVNTVKCTNGDDRVCKFRQ